ncbi:unnamed protein product [Bursaphelenchus okinawaensis]|uniref:Uncharacterized protein n=1 Tax=Bursaphelenchus okinawaensis TaxID=465554 RepID=A0A811KQ89_9BILA|nr:unnamed protein product [Bursaphelenchus okinawaensis]CAG9107867.1 unnamed protein product [Bursaphelenchus okinawaensis]
MTVYFTAFWEKQSNEWQAEHRHLLLAFWALDVYLDPIDTTEAKLLQNSELLKNKVDPLVVLANHCSRWGDYQKSITLIRLAKTLEQDHPDLGFHELSYQYYNAGKNQDMSGIHTACAAIDSVIFGRLKVAKGLFW